jgi:enoyl-CoA hydratase/carnithine racemase
MSDRVTCTLDGGVADVRLNRPDKRNALDGAMFAAIAEVGEQLKTQAGLRAVVLSGEGAAFCAGLDFGSFQQMAGGDQPADDGQVSPADLPEGRITHLGQQTAWVWQEVPVPVIAAVHGHALGGGLQIALGADIRFCAPDAQLSVREVHWGLVPDMTGTFVLSRLVRPDIAKELVLTAKVVSGEEAYRLGLVTHVTANPFLDAMALAKEIAARSPEAVRGAKALLNRAPFADAAEQFADERRVIGSLIGRPNQIEAVMANFEKRPANFED